MRAEGETAHIVGKKIDINLMTQWFRHHFSFKCQFDRLIHRKNNTNKAMTNYFILHLIWRWTSPIWPNYSFGLWKFIKKMTQWHLEMSSLFNQQPKTMLNLEKQDEEKLKTTKRWPLRTWNQGIFAAESLVLPQK